ncbi:hypothetical protein EKO27_g10174 [Xylaria grammica]|uniref:Carrier domain-containing protein n=1 Tax=Xylaria grammica TaxID=363999 RepID=A0A439CS09_9PEZI|nr:hypothetical protein EKO27_g10174 [Xylaria grammica]
MAHTHSSVARWQYDLLPHIVDRVARNSPDTAYGLWPTSSTSYEGGYQTITYSQLANAVNGLAWWLVEHLGPGQADVVAYPCHSSDTGPNDVRLTALLLAAIKTNYVLFFPSPRNSAAAHKALLDTLGCDRTYEKNGREPIWAIHTSGSTGFPKPIIWTSEAIARHHSGTDAAPPAGVRSLDHFERGRRVLTTLPPFHGAGLGQYLFWGIPFGSTPIAPVAAAIPTAQGLVDALKQTPADVALLVPSIVAELAEDPVSLDYVATHVKLLVYLGGDLPQAIGDRALAVRAWAAGLVLYIRLHPCSGAVFEKTVDGAYELVFRRQESLLATQSMWGISGQEQLDEFRTRDLFEPHPTVADVWCWRARTDDIIVFLNGEKTNPVTMEQSVVAANPELTGAIVVGTQRFQAALLPSIEEANSIAPAHARIEKSMVLITSPDRPLIRAAKGTIQRPVSLSQYSTELDKLYSDAYAQADTTTEIYSPMGADMLTRRIRDIVLETTNWHDIGDSTSFFDSGMDSPQALRIVRTLRRDLGVSHLALSALYQNASITRLTTAILTHKSSENDGGLMQSLLSTYSGLLQQIKPARSDDAHASSTGAAATGVILTGSTGTLGTYILRALLDRPALPRALRSQLPSAPIRRQPHHPQRLAGQFQFGSASLSTTIGRAGELVHAVQRRGGVARKEYEVPVRVIRGGVVDGKPGLAPEALVELQPHAGSSGYSNSKLIAEHLCDCAARHLAAPVLVARVGQVAGAIRHKGRWNPAEWLPSLVISSRHLGCLPNSLGLRFSAVDWVPVDALADVVVDMVTQLIRGDGATAEGARVFNIRNPAVISWEKLLPAIQEGIEAEPGRTDHQAVEVVLPEMWLSRLEKSIKAATTDDEVSAAIMANPAIKLVEFYQNSVWNVNGGPASMATMAIEKTLDTSPTLRDLPPVSLSWMRKWVDEWLAPEAGLDI